MSLKGLFTRPISEADFAKQPKRVLTPMCILCILDFYDPTIRSSNNNLFTDAKKNN